MTLDEAINHAKEVAILNENTCKAKPDSNLKKYKKCAEEHRQLAEWLRDYKRLLEQQPCEDCVSREFMYALGATCIATRDKNDKLIAIAAIENLPSVAPKTNWIPVSERLPDERDWYLGIFKEPDTGWINPIPYICDYVGCETEATTKDYWILNGFTNEDEHIDYYFNLECVAWRPITEPYQEEYGEKTKNQ